MSIFRSGCKHQWQEVGRTYNASRFEGNIEMWGKPRVDVERLAYGFTTVELRCSTCGDLTHRRVAGRADA